MNNKEKNFVSAVVYIHNAEAHIKAFLEMIINSLEANFEHSEIICVNDSSTDSSLTEIKKISSRAVRTNVTVINMSYYHGLEMAMNAGIDIAIGDFVFEFDNTVLDFDSEMLMIIYRRSLEGFDMVSASPDKKERLSSRLFYTIFDRFTDRPCNMHTESFRILSRRMINRISSMNKTVPYRKVVYANSGLKTDNIKYQICYTKATASDSNEKRYRSSLAIDSLILFTELGYRFSVTMTAIMIFISVFMVIYSATIYVTSHPVAGWTTTILFLSVAFLGLFGILTVIIKYLQLLVNLIFKRKHYSFESIEKLTR